MAITINQIISRLREVSEAHLQLNSFDYGEDWEFFSSGDINYPTMLARLEGGSISSGQTEVRIAVGVFDQPNNGEGDELEILSDTHSIILDVIAQLNDPDYEWFFSADGVTLTNFSEWGTDRLSGWWAELVFRKPFDNNRCAIGGKPTITQSKTIE